MKSELKGFCHPLSPEGRTQLVGDLPWHHSSAVMGINFRADPAEIQKLLPEPYEISAVEPDCCGCFFGDWLSVWEGDKDLLARNPERAQYKECAIFVRCRFKRIEGVRSVYIWVDKDFSMLRGWFMGYPKILGRIYIGHSNKGAFAVNPAFGEFGPGTEFGSFVEAHGERLVYGSMKLSKRISPNELPPPFGSPRLNIIHFPSAYYDSRRPLLNQLIQVGSPDKKPTQYGDVWAGDVKDATLIFKGSELDEHTTLRPLEITGAYYAEFGFTFKGNTLLHEW